MDKIYYPIIESLIFASEEPVTLDLIYTAIKEIDGDDIDFARDEIENVIDEINVKYSSSDFAYNIVKVSNGFAFATKPEYGKYVGYLSTEKSKRRLSQAAIETLAIIAYKQPITKPELETIRGVNSDYIITTLMEKNLITMKGRAETIGRPLLYGTTDEFLKYFGLYQISDLPKPREIEEIMKDEDFIEQKNKIMMNLVEEDLEREEKNDIEQSPAE